MSLLAVYLFSHQDLEAKKDREQAYVEKKSLFTYIGRQGVAVFGSIFLVSKEIIFINLTNDIAANVYALETKLVPTSSGFDYAYVVIIFEWFSGPGCSKQDLANSRLVAILKSVL